MPVTGDVPAIILMSQQKVARLESADPDPTIPDKRNGMMFLQMVIL